jgi:hypothetical protein
MAELMTPEQAAQFVEKCEHEFKARYSSEDKSYQQITSQPQTQPPLVISQPRPHDQEQRRYQQQQHHSNHGHHRDHHDRHQDRSHHRDQDHHRDRSHHREYDRHRDNRGHY